MRLRLPLGWLSSILVVLMWAGLFILLDTRTVPKKFSTWQVHPILSNVMFQTGLFLLIGAGVFLTISLLFELTLRQGWKPKSLRKMLGGVYVERKFSVSSDRGKIRLYILVRLATGHQEEFECDSIKYQEIEEGNSLNIYVIGPYLESYRTLDVELAESVKEHALRWGLDTEIKPFLKAYGTYYVKAGSGLFAACVFCAASRLLAIGLTAIVTGQVYWWEHTDGSREVFIEENWVPFAGIGLIFLSMGMIFLLIRGMQKGIDSEDEYAGRRPS